MCAAPFWGWFDGCGVPIFFAMAPTPGRCVDLARLISRGAVEHDLVRMHGAIVASLEVFPVEDATRLVFAEALDRLASRPALHALARAAISAHVEAYREAT